MYPKARFKVSNATTTSQYLPDIQAGRLTKENKALCRSGRVQFQAWFCFGLAPLGLAGKQGLSDLPSDLTEAQHRTVHHSILLHCCSRSDILLLMLLRNSLSENFLFLEDRAEIPQESAFSRGFCKASSRSSGESFRSHSLIITIPGKRVCISSVPAGDFALYSPETRCIVHSLTA